MDNSGKRHKNNILKILITFHRMEASEAKRFHNYMVYKNGRLNQRILKVVLALTTQEKHSVLGRSHATRTFKKGKRSTTSILTVFVGIKFEDYSIYC